MNFKLRKIEQRDNAEIAKLIKTVMPEFGASGPGFAINDPEVNAMFEAYNVSGRVYFVVTDGQVILGGGGIAPLDGENQICELRKMYFYPEIRGKGLGQQVMDLCLSAAKEMGYKECYLETLKLMHGARKLYVKNGFREIPHAMGNTGHFSCDSYFLRTL